MQKSKRYQVIQDLHKYDYMSLQLHGMVQMYCKSAQVQMCLIAKKEKSTKEQKISSYQVIEDLHIYDYVSLQLHGRVQTY